MQMEDEEKAKIGKKLSQKKYSQKTKIEEGSNVGMASPAY
jgi:hypothetical protein